jgi:acyl-CoA thioesterase FadM
MSNDNDTVQDELASLKARADLMGVAYHPSIGLEKLRDKVHAVVEADGVLNTDTAVEKEQSFSASDESAPVAETEVQYHARKKREASELVRIRITPMNPAKLEWDGEIFTAGNSLVGSFTKYVPFNNDEGWHVPRIIYHMIRDRMCQIFVTAKDSRGNTTRQGKLIKEFGIEIMPDLTTEELNALAVRQAVSQSVT